jgi:hypothetical protein
MKKWIRLFTGLALAVLISNTAWAGKKNDNGAGFGALFYNDEIRGTVATVTSMPGKGIDVIYVVTNGQEGQLGVTTVAPGDTNYHGGRWKVYVVTWESDTPVPLFTSAAAVEESIAVGELSVMRVPTADFVCPVLQKTKN